MKVKQLIEILSAFDPESKVILQKDGEGNGYSPLAGADNNAVYIPRTTWWGEVYHTTWDAYDAGMTEEEWSEILQRPRCVVLFPVN